MADTLSNIIDPTPDIIERLGTDYAGLKAQVDAYDAEAAQLPTEILQEDERHQFADALSRMQKTAKTIEAARTAEKAPYLASERAVDGFFGQISRKLSEVVEDLNACLTAYLKKLRDAERAKAEAEAAEQRRKAEEARAEELKARQAAADAQRASDRRRAEEEAAAAAATARRHDEQSVAAGIAAYAKPAELVRGRSETGKLSTLRTLWKGEIEDLDELDIVKLKPFFTRAQLEQALNAYVRAGHRELRGANIYESAKAQTRG